MTSDKQRIIALSEGLNQASNEIRILRNLAWPNEVKEEFFKKKEQRLPEVEYPSFDPKPVLEILTKTRKQIVSDTDPVDQWAKRIADKLESSARLLAARGSSEFLEHTTNMYGQPGSGLTFGSGTTLELALHFESMFENFKDNDLGAPPDACILADTLADEMRKVVEKQFGEKAPEVVMDSSLASNALAGRRRISIKPSACFTDKDINQLIHHEIHVHVATSHNGNNQPHIQILGEGHAGTTKTQEGIAVFAEFITGSTDIDRVRRLADRVIATQMAIDGADFIQVYKYFLGKTDNPYQSFENAKRVFRGGLVSGKVPFTKDIVYLEGLITVHNFLHTAISQKKLDYIDLLFVGKLDISDIPVLHHFADLGLIEPAQYKPGWIEDKRFLISYLSYSSFLNGIETDELKNRLRTMVD